jgi:hypothetical protein
MSKQKEVVTMLSPVGRLVQGSLYEAQTKDIEGKQLIDKDGHPRNRYYFALAIKKGSEKHWNETEWGKKVWQVGEENAPTGVVKRADFAWKIEDGDSDTPNMNDKRNCDNEGFPGHWILKFNTFIAPQIVNEFAEPLTQEGFIQAGYYIQVYFSVSYNNPAKKANVKNGIFLNPEIVSFQAYGEVIKQFFRPDPKTIGFGGELPAGASATPVSQLPEASTALKTKAEPYPQILDPKNVSEPPADKKVMIDGHVYELDVLLKKGWTEKALADAGHSFV